MQSDDRHRSLVRDLRCLVPAACELAFHQEPQRCRAVSSGANPTFMVKLPRSGSLVLRFLIEQDLEGVAIERTLQDLAARQGIRTPDFIELNGQDYAEIGSYYFTVSHRLSGLHPRLPSAMLAESMGQTLACLHRAWQGVAPVRPRWLSPFSLHSQARIFRHVHELGVIGLDRMSSDLLSRGLPSALIHGDLTVGNVFAYRESVTSVFDLETAERNLRIVDIARTALGLTAEGLHPETASQAVIRGYEKVQSLTSAERQCFPEALSYAFLGCSIWFADHRRWDRVEAYATAIRSFHDGRWPIAVTPLPS